MKKYGVVVVGCGKIGQEHLSDIYYRENVNIVGVVDINEETAQVCARKFNAESWSVDWRDYLKRDDVDIVIIATYIDTHMRIMRACLENGKHVLCEKPVVATEQGVKEFADLVLSSNCKVRVGYILRHNETYKYVQNCIENGLIGKPIVMRMVQNHHAMNWERYKRLLKDCSPIVDCGVHYFDIMQWFTGADITSVHGIKAAVDDDLDVDEYNYGLVTVTLSDGSVGYYEAGWGQSISADNVKEFIGPKGRLRIVYSTNRYEHREEGDLIEYFDAKTHSYNQINLVSQYKPMWVQFSSLVEAIEKDLPNKPHVDAVCASTLAAINADKALLKGEIIYMNGGNKK
ncbi:MAG: Gfo/Idh/MocA family oxidoreductase [Ruminococcaceae bacterium]|nr:Gfo/Idh/MocA family oxidoreductase [Oscillospiraceae bacterium]